MNVPETMNEVLDMSDDEGKKKSFHVIVVCFHVKFIFGHLHIISNIFLFKLHSP